MEKLYFLDPTDTLDQLKDYYFPPYITLAHMFHAPKGWGLKPRLLKQYQLQYVIEGSAAYRIEGKEYETKRGDLLLHRPSEMHQVLTRLDEPYVCISIVFHFGVTAFPFHEWIASDTHDMGNYANQSLENKLSELVVHYRQPGIAHQLQSQNLLMQILLQIAAVQGQAYGTTAGKKEDSNTAKLILLRNHIAGHYEAGFRHEELESLCGWSRNYIITQFTAAFGMSPMQYLIWVRIEKAKELALQSGLTFGEIANRVGYANVHAFGKTFKRKTGMSLSQFCATLFKETPDS
jgi:AraC-like DNA-binding protein